VAIGYGAELVPECDQRIYLASAETLLDLVRGTPDEADRLLLVGHNPGMESLALLLTRAGDGGRRGEIEAKYPTGSLAEISFAVASWREIKPDEGRLERFVRPRDLDPELGPDEDTE
jgi:phosphohistidine phosphatase